MNYYDVQGKEILIGMNIICTASGEIETVFEDENGELGILGNKFDGRYSILPLHLFAHEPYIDGFKLCDFAFYSKGLRCAKM
jgi:hypothetical protein